MALNSPLFQSSMELLGRSITHFNGGEELDRKLLILHLANAVEILFKDMLLDLGESIYKNPKETVTVTGSIEMLKAKGVSIPFLNKIELLIDERNALQHRFGSPNELTAIFYMSIAEDFFKDVLRNHYKKDFDSVIAEFARQEDLLAFRMRTPLNESELENLRKLSRIHPLGALLSAMSYLERRIDGFETEIGLRPEMRMSAGSAILSDIFLREVGVEFPEELSTELNEIRTIRNLAAHGRKDPTKQDADKAIGVIEKYEKALEAADKTKVRARVMERREQPKRERTVTEVLGHQGAADNPSSPPAASGG